MLEKLVALASAVFLAEIALAGSSSALAGSHAEASFARAYVTTPDARRRFAADPSPIEITRTLADMHSARIRVDALITIDEHRRYQTVAGFGAALTGSSAHLIAGLRDHGAALLAELFRRDSGIGLSYVRLSVGASDFATSNYTYDDLAAGRSDATLAAFTTRRDSELFEIVDGIQANSRDVRFMASPWTAPAWMKTSDASTGGELRADAYGVYARYLVAYMKALQARGISLDALTPENEPLNDVATGPSMEMSGPEEATFVRDALGPALRSSFPRTKLLVYDDNWDDIGYPLLVYGDREAAEYVAGAAFHCYAGDVSAMSRLELIYPKKAVYLTECGGGAWAPSFGDDLHWDVRNLVIGGTANWAKTVLLWNLALDDAAGPMNHGCTNCRGVVTIHSDGTITRNVEYYVLAHVAKFVRPGAVRVATMSSIGALLPNVAFANADGSSVVIALNAATHQRTVQVRFGSRSFRYTIPAGAVVTFRWK